MGRKTKLNGPDPGESKARTPQSEIASGSTAAFTAAALLLAAVILAVYAPVFRYGFVSMDDPFFTTGRFTDGLTFANFKWAFSGFYYGYYAPLTLLSHMLDFTMFGTWAGGFHLTSLLIHLANTLLLLACLRRATKMPWRSFLVAALFALHPLHVESVAWIAERKDVLSTFFEFLALYAWLRYVDQKSIARYAAVFLAFACALMSKSMAITFPFLLLLLDYWPLGRWELPSAGLKTGTWWKSLKPVLIEKIPLMALIPISAWLTFLAQIKENALSTAGRLPLDQRIANALLAYGRYIRNMVVPSGLVAYVPHLQGNYSVPLVILAALFLAVCTGAALYWGRRVRYLPVGWFWFLGSLAPVIGLVQTGLHASADRFTYVPLTGLFILIVWGAFDVLHISPADKRLWIRGTAAALLVVLAVLSFNQVGTWRNTEVLFRRVLAYYPWSPFALINLGIELIRQNRNEEAVSLYERASTLTRSIPPDHLLSWGSALSKLARYQEAAHRFESVLAVDPDSGQAHLELGFALSQLQRPSEAIPHYRKAYGRPGVQSDSLLWIGDVYRKGDLCGEAVQIYRIIAPTDPAYPRAAAGISACGGKP